MPLTPFFRLCQKLSTSFPTGVMAPNPEITTRRSFILQGLGGRRIGKVVERWRRVNALKLPRSHADALHRLEKFAFGFDRRCDDDFRLLKLWDVAYAHITHASGNGADQILAPVVYFGRTEQNLLERASGADFDPRASWQVGMGRCHPPMIASAGSFGGSGEGTPNHDGVGPAGQRFANIAAFAHSPIGNDRNETRRLFEISITGGGTIHRGSDLRNAQAEDTARGTRCARANANQNRGWAAGHDLKCDVVADRVTHNHRYTHVCAKFRE